MSTALVTGAAGFIGSHLVEELLQRGYRVHGLDNGATGDMANLAQARKNPDFTFINGDIRDADVVSRALEDVESVFHLAAYTSVPGSFERSTHVSDVNCMGTANVLETAVQLSVESVMIASSAAVYGSEAPVPVSESDNPSPESPYASSKLYAEQLGQQFSAEFGLDVVALRFFNVYGPRQDSAGEYAAVIPKFIQLMTKGDRPIIFGDGEQTRDFIYVTDAAQASVDAIEADLSGVFNIARGKRVSINKLVTDLNEALGTEIVPRYEGPRPGDIRHSGATISKAHEAFGFEPSVGLENGLQETVSLFRR